MTDSVETSVVPVLPSLPLIRRLALTLLLLAVSRIPNAIPLPGIDFKLLWLDPWHLAPVTRFSLGALGTTPYVCAWIMLFLIRACMPSSPFLGARLEHAVRSLALVLALVQGFVVGMALQQPDRVGDSAFALPIAAAVALAATVLLLIWLADLINRHGIGPGMPLIIATALLAPLPLRAWVSFESWRLGAMSDKAMAALLAAIFATVLVTVFVARARYRLPIGARDESTSPLLLTLIPAGIVAPLCVMTAGYVFEHSALTLIRHLDPHFAGGKLVVFGIGALVFLMAMNVFGPLMQDPAELAKAAQQRGGEFTAAQIQKLTRVLGAIGGTLLALIVELPDIVTQELLRERSPISGSQVMILTLVVLACLDRVEAEAR